MAFSVFDQVVLVPAWRRVGQAPGEPKRRREHEARPRSQRRLALNLRVEDLAELAGVSTWTVWRWESRQVVRGRSAQRLLRALQRAERALA